MAEMSSRYKYVKGLADSAAERAKGFHLEYQKLSKLSRVAAEDGDFAGAHNFAKKAEAKLNDFFYWIGHANAYRGIALQVDFMETVEADEDSEFTCP